MGAIQRLFLKKWHIKCIIVKYKSIDQFFLKHSKHKILTYCHIKKDAVFLNGKLLFEISAEDFSGFSKAIYQKLDVLYPKFFKMDNLSKIAFLASEIVLNQTDISSEEKKTALIFSNRASSLDTDRKFQQSISAKDAYFPSPAVFVYTLPNICMGEICIRHKLFAENSFFIFERFNASHLQTNAAYLLNTKKADKALCGWVDFDGENYEAFLYLVARDGLWPHETGEIERLYDDNYRIKTGT